MLKVHFYCGRCADQMHQSDAPVRCTGQMRRSDAPVRCADQMRRSDAPIGCADHGSGLSSIAYLVLSMTFLNGRAFMSRISVTGS